jgi:hypothetical protein
MTQNQPDDPRAYVDALSAIGERLIYLKQRARHCRRVAQSCQNSAVAAALEEMADRYEAEALLVAPPTEQQ